MLANYALLRYRRFVLLNHFTLFALREAKGITKSEIATDAEVSLSYYCEIELGKKKPSEAVIGRIADALGVNIYALTNDVGGKRALTKAKTS